MGHSTSEHYCSGVSQVLVLSLCAVALLAKWYIKWQTILLKNTKLIFSIGFRNLQRLKYSNGTKFSDLLLQLHWLVMSRLCWNIALLWTARFCVPVIRSLLAGFLVYLTHSYSIKTLAVPKKSPVFIEHAHLTPPVVTFTSRLHSTCCTALRRVSNSPTPNRIYNPSVSTQFFMFCWTCMSV